MKKKGTTPRSERLAREHGISQAAARSGAVAVSLKPKKKPKGR